MNDKLDKAVAQLQSGWLAPHERPILVRWPGHVASTIGNSRLVPHVPQGSTPPTRAPQLRAEIHPAVREGRFWNDEWVHDPATWGWAYAQRPDQLAIRLADHCVAGRAASVLVLTTHRLAVVIETKFFGEPEPEPEGQQETSTGGGLFGKAMALARSLQSNEDGDGKEPKPEVPLLTTLWEVPLSAVRGFRPIPKGRDLEHIWHLAIDFADGSMLEFFAEYAQSDVLHIHKCFQRVPSPDPTAPPIQPR
ncbi:hypothetical protein [Streptoalloteichus hindustanus]|uniref:Uncharacterized protein n=1 Tax=Streptoalloteichus hindustanus TaxID=2017 RepID=A0A1M5N9U9_STRHI|nr:hypothetical protein [Streptoalloteichus hindustanus]SHG85783.1 hypothetical protein SAMN05444320_11530 [Streptoalloteichus hindustanus]